MKDSNSRKMDSNPIYRMKLKVEDQAEGFKSLSYGLESLLALNSNFAKEIRILIKWIRIPIPISLPEDQDSNPKGMDPNLDSRKSQEC